MTKLTWDNALLLGPAMAERLKVEKMDMVKLDLNGKSMELPVWVQAGHPDNSVTVFYGYGRKRSGRAGNGAGFDVYPLRYSATPDIAFGNVTKTSGHYLLSSTQGYQTMDVGDQGRPIVRNASLEQYKEKVSKGEGFSEEAPKPDETMYNLTRREEVSQKEAYAWGMTIDHNACVGCNNCIIACQAENNIPVVGKEQVNKGRHMHWLRVDVYYQGDRHNPKAYFQPVPCMQCEDAPCEVVCPVGATTHSTEGLNDMIYNRCVGTRYCSNNCPYKVRRFNFFLFQDWDTPQLKMQRNPDVSVRSRGVMEKCTYCVQRITHARIAAEEATTERGKIDPIANLQTACQQSCPANAIIFGNINDPNSAVSRFKARNRNYAVLDDLNTRPRTTYLAAIRNPNPELEGKESS
jgi:molybdopterin-containing oxidoreductase family iron-sulfur binding subunit